jgi:hypothetical protein
MKRNHAFFVTAAGMLLCAAIFPVQAANPYMNLDLNPSDVRAAGHGFPHASSNSEYPCVWTSGGPACAPDTTFLALNAIDGKTKNDCHGSLACASWGPQQAVTGLWWRVEFGHSVQADKVVIWIRHDFPHDSWWKNATLVFSDSSKVPIHPDSTALPDTFKFTSRVTTDLTITDLVPNANTWCAFTEVQVWGYDKPTAVVPAAPKTSLGKSAALCYMPGFSSKSITPPPHARTVALYTIEGKKVWSAPLRDVIGRTAIVPIPGNIAKGIYRINYLAE